MYIALAAVLLLMALLAAIALVRMSNTSRVPSAKVVGVAPAAISFAVLGDSDSHAYQDSVLIALDSGKRGGKYRATTFQWTEVLAQLRANQINQGEWGIWGTPIKVAETLDWLGLGGRAPRKRDFRYNFAVSGADCNDLITGYYRQAIEAIGCRQSALAEPELGGSHRGDEHFVHELAVGGGELREHPVDLVTT